ncbi:MAG: polysaccharide export protein [Candidatus Omnitrophica bacterium]|jgi:polysaccharide export outer membrane protein|nr:polysaccharide export protein [Candidatus Omnitrophota bacterium]
MRLVLLIFFSISILISYPFGINEGFGQAIAFGEDNSSYRIKAGDTLEISVYGEPDLVKTVKVTEEGKIIYPFIGEMNVINMTLKEAVDAIEAFLRKDYFVNPQVNIFVKEYSKFFIVGAVKEEGRFELKGNLTLLDAIALAGGANPNANLSNIKVVRNLGKEEKQYNVDLYTKGKDFMLESLDRIIVEKYGAISVLGEVRRPGNYAFTKGLTAVDAIASAGGFSDIANQNAVKVIRETKEGKKEIFNVPVAHILKSGDKSKDVMLKEGDIVSIPESFF